nr:N-acetylmuramoyl-L-alanine amidase [Sphingomonas baiyangensis]
MSWFVALLACWFGGMPALAGDIEQVRIDDDRIVVRFEGQVARASSFLLVDPRRIALDLDGVRPGAHIDGAGLVSAVRQGVRDGEHARIVFDLARPAIVTEGRFDRDGRTLTLELKTVDDARFARAAAAGRSRFDTRIDMARRPDTRSHRVSLPVPAAKKAPPLPRIHGDDDSRPLVVIDPGHGGHDPGSISPVTGEREKDLALKTALAIRDKLVESGRVRVALTRETDRYILHRERYGVARRLKADLFISLHCDSAGNPQATGATAYTLSEIASDKEAALLAARENKADVLSGIDLADTSTDISSLLIDLAQRETMNRSAGFARLLGREAQPLIATKAQFHRMASLMVLKAPDMPSILFETGYISNEKDARFIGSREGRDKIAESVKRAVEIHFARRMASR